MSERTLIALSISLMLTLFHGLSPLAADDRPADLQLLLNQHEEGIAKLKRENGERLEALLEKLRSDLKALQVKYTRETLLDEAVAIRDFLRRLGEDNEHDVILDALQASHDSLPRDANAAISRISGPAQELISTHDESLRSAHQSLKVNLEGLLDKYAKAGDLDAALAARAAMTSAAANQPGESVVKRHPAKADISFPSEFEPAERKYKELLSKLQQDQQAATNRLMNALITSLNSEQNRATRAGKLDDAVSLRNLAKSLEAEKSPAKQLELIHGNLTKMTGEGRTAADRFLEANQLGVTDAQKEIGLLNTAFAPVLKEPIKGALLAADEPKSRQLLEYYQSLISQPSMMHYRHQKPPFSKEALKLVEPFEAATELRKKACEESEIPVRHRLVEGFRNLMPDAKDAELKAITKAIEFFTADYTAGPQRGRLFVPDPDLANGAIKLYDDYCRETVKLEQQLAADQIATAKILRDELHAVLLAHVSADEFVEAWSILARGPEFDRVRFETPVKFAHVPHWADHLTDAVVLDVKKNAVLVRQNSHQDIGVWVPRGRVRFSPDDRIVAVKIGDPLPGPGIPVTDSTQLKRGQTVFYMWSSSVYEATVVDLTGTGVIIKYKERWHNETVPRINLRLMSDY